MKKLYKLVQTDRYDGLIQYNPHYYYSIYHLNSVFQIFSKNTKQVKENEELIYRELIHKHNHAIITLKWKNTMKKLYKNCHIDILIT